MSAPSGDATGDLQRRVEQAQIRELFRHSYTGIVGTSVAGSLVASVLHSEIPTPRVLAWLAALFIVLAGRAVVTARYRPDGSEAHIRMCGRLNAAGSFSTGLAWGLALILLWPADPLLQLVLGITIVGMSAAAAAAYSSVVAAFVPFMLVMMGPMIARFLLERTAAQRTVGLLSLVYLWVLMRVGLTMHRATAEALRVGIENRALAAEAEAASRAKGDFVANISHEIRTPMNAIIGLSELSLRSNPPPRLRQDLERIRTASRTLLRLVSDVLDFSKIESGKLDMEEIAFDPHAVLDDVSRLLSPEASRKGVELQASAQADVPRALVGDPLRLGQILTNLVGNAVKFTHEGRVVVGAECLRSLADRVVLRLSVEDTGIGIAPEKLPRLGDSFWQADGSTTRRYGGSGLGLTISRRLIELMGGRLQVESETGRGTRFWFDLDLPRATHATEAREAEPALPASAATLAGAKVLVVEDNAINRDVAREMLQLAGVEVDVAESAREALERTSQVRYDAVLMDVQMPDMDGLEATRRLRMDPRHADLPVLALTAHAMKDERDRCLAAGMNDYLTKPIDMDRLLGTLARSIGGGRAVPQAAVDVAGLDLEAARRRLGGNEALLRSLLGRFVAEFGGSADEIRRDLANGQRRLARGRVHAARGVASNLSAARLASAAAALEATLGEPDGSVDGPLDAYAAALAEVVAAEAPVPGDGPSVPPAAQPSLPDFLRLLRARDLKALDQAPALIESLAARMPASERETLRARVESLDFAAALDMLEGLAARQRR